MVLFLLNKINSRTLVLSINSVTVTSQVVVNDVMHSQSPWRGRDNETIIFIVKWRKKNIVLDQSERSIFTTYY